MVPDLFLLSLGTKSTLTLPSLGWFLFFVSSLCASLTWSANFLSLLFRKNLNKLEKTQPNAIKNIIIFKIMVINFENSLIRFKQNKVLNPITENHHLAFNIKRKKIQKPIQRAVKAH